MLIDDCLDAADRFLDAIEARPRSSLPGIFIQAFMAVALAVTILWTVVDISQGKAAEIPTDLFEIAVLIATWVLWRTD